jgi:hypothetical protein
MTLKKNPFYFLLGGLLVALLITPMVTQHHPGVAGLLLTLTLLIAALSLSASKRMYRAAWALIATKIVLDVVGHFHPQLGIHIAETAVLTAFFILATVFAFRRVLDGEYVDMNRIAGAISIYMLFGLIWASLYFFLSLMDPQAFNGLPDLSSLELKLTTSAYMDLLYYSYVTLSTLGYGDITPVSRAAQALSYLEAICGVMYVAVLVAALVGSYGNKRVAQA